jgi:hypothetical protein
MATFLIVLVTVAVGVLVARARIAATDAEDRRRGHVLVSSRWGTRTYRSAQWTQAQHHEHVAAKSSVSVGGRQ